MPISRDRWTSLRPELLRRHTNQEPIRTSVRGVPNAILEVGQDYVIVQSSQGRGNPREIFAQGINDGDIGQYLGRRRIIQALRDTSDALISS